MTHCSNGLSSLSCIAFSLAVAACLPAEELPPTRQPEPHQAKEIDWQTDYAAALDEAASHGRMTLIWFYDPQAPENNSHFAKTTQQDPRVIALIERDCVAVKLPTSARARVNDQHVELLRHPDFREMLGRPGLALIDMTDCGSSLFRRVVSIYPFAKQAITADQLITLLELPRGTLTQRTLIFAVRTHAERPASAASRFSPLLAGESESHSAHQARITVQGHHNWDSRFHSINARLPRGLVAQEVCAESWPGQNLLDAAVECVHSWRQSPGHWSAVSRQSEYFAYDMKRGRNGIWYATGIFARRH
jgi:hypothetical protein